MFFHSDQASRRLKLYSNDNVSNPSRDVFPFWPTTAAANQRRANQEFQTLPGMFFHSDRTFQTRSPRKSLRFQTLPGMFFHSDVAFFPTAVLAQQLVSNPSRDVFPFWLNVGIESGVERLRVSNPSRDVFPFWRANATSDYITMRGGFKPFQGCFSILTCQSKAGKSGVRK